MLIEQEEHFDVLVNESDLRLSVSVDSDGLWIEQTDGSPDMDVILLCSRQAVGNLIAVLERAQRLLP
jgi:hypothetical protein